MPTEPKTQHLELTLPAAPECLSLARLHVGVVASWIDMTLEETEDLQLAVEELCLSVLAHGHDDLGRLQLDVRWGPAQVDVRCRLVGRTAGAAAGAVEPSELSRLILDALVDAHGTTSHDGVEVAWLEKRRVPHGTAP
jgi:hypothetical protein